MLPKTLATEMVYSIGQVCKGDKQSRCLKTGAPVLKTGQHREDG
jgi:hypothetical protein